MDLYKIFEAFLLLLGILLVAFIVFSIIYVIIQETIKNMHITFNGNSIFIEKIGNYSKFSIILFAAIFLLVGYYAVNKAYIGTEDLNSFLRKDYFASTYYVNVFENEKNSKNYRLKADISVKGNQIIVNKVYWPNGGYFAIDNFYEYSLKIGERINLRDEKGIYRDIELTNIKAK